MPGTIFDDVAAEDQQQPSNGGTIFNDVEEDDNLLGNPFYKASEAPKATGGLTLGPPPTQAPDKASQLVTEQRQRRASEYPVGPVSPGPGATRAQVAAMEPAPARLTVPEPRRFQPEEVSKYPNVFGDWEGEDVNDVAPTPSASQQAEREAFQQALGNLKPTDYVGAAVNAAINSPSGPPMPAGGYPGTGLVQHTRQLGTPGQRVGGMAGLVGDVGDLATPFMGAGALQAPVSAAIGVGTGYVSGLAAREAVKKLGGNEQWQDLAEQVGFWVPTAAGTLLRPQFKVVRGSDGRIMGVGAGVLPDEGGMPSIRAQWAIPRRRGLPSSPAPATPPEALPQPPTIEAQPPTLDEIADAQRQTNYAGREETKAQIEKNRAAQAAAVAPPEAPTPEKGPVSSVTPPVRKVRPRASQPAPAQPSTPQPAAAPIEQKTGGTIFDEVANEQPIQIAKSETPEVPGEQVSGSVSKGQEAPAETRKPGEETPTAVEQPTYKHRSTQANIPDDSEAGQALTAARSRISDSDLAGKGKDIDGNHVTVRYGLKEGSNIDAVREFLSQQAPFEASLGPTDKFPPSQSSDGAAVIMAPIEADELHRLNAEIEKHGDFAPSNFPEYKPHATVAYVQPDKASRYVGMNVTQGKKFTVDQIAITDREGKQEMVKLGGKLKEPAPPTEREKLGLPPKPGDVGHMRVSDLRVNANKFQYKLGTDTSGTSTLLKETKVFNPDLAGTISVWKEPETGVVYVVNGHHRYDLAKRLGVKRVAVRHIIAKNAAEARAVGARQNIGEGRGTAIDAAKFFRETGATPEKLEEHGISLGEATAQNGLHLSRLSDSLFQKVVQGDLALGQAIAIGEGTADHAEQAAILKQIERKERGGSKVSADRIREFIRLAKGSEQRTETTADLFGSQEVARSLAWEKSEVSEYIKQQLAKDKKLFGFVAKGERAVELERGGNKIDVEKSKEISTGAAQAAEVYEKLSTKGGPISDILNRSAARLADGENAATVKADAYEQTRAEISKLLSPRTRQVPEGLEAGAGRGKVGENPSLYSQAVAPTFYSKAERVAEQKLPPSAPGNQILNTLRNGGVKEDEIKWLGLDDFLKDKPKVSKSDVQAFIRENQVQVKEVSKGGTRDQGRIDELNQQRDAIIADLEAEGYGVDNVGAHYDVESDGQWLKHGTQGYRELPREVFYALGQLEDVDRELRSMQSEARTQTKFSSYTLPGDKQNYTELLLTLPTPPRKVMDTIAREMGFGGWTSQLTKEQEAKVIAAFDAQPSERPKFTSGHFEEPNILAHVRFDDRKDADGKKLLFVEEVQSDWHQRGKRQGYADPAAAQNARKLKDDADLARQRLFPLIKAADDLGFDTTTQALDAIKFGNLGPEHLDPRDVEKLAPAMTEYRSAYEAYEKVRDVATSGVPNAPFKTTWHELALKRMIRYAAENGYDKIGFTTGEQQADRYDLSKQVDKIEVVPRTDAGTGEKTRSVWINLRGSASPVKLGVDTRGFVDNASESRLAGQPLSDVVGKDLADKIMANDRQTIEGVDLKIGGEGMKGFYDKIVPDFLNKYGKKWGAKVGETKLGTGGKWTVYNEDGQALQTYATESEAAQRTRVHLGEFFESNGQPNESIHSLTVTPDMKRSVMEEGQPLFHQEAPITGRSEQAENEIATQARFEVVKPGGRVPTYVRLNRNAMQLIHEADGEGVQFVGVNFGPQRAKEVLHELAMLKSNHAYNEASKTNIDKLIQTLDSVIDKHDGLNVVRQGDTPEQEIHTLTEEGFHSAVQRRPGHGDLRLGGVPVLQMVNDPGMSRMSMNHNWPNGLVAVAEGMADVFLGDHDLSPEQAEKTAGKYYSILADRHGIEPLEAAQELYDYFDKRAAEAGLIKPGEQYLAEETRPSRDALTRVLARARGEKSQGSSKETRPERGTASGGTHEPLRSGTLERNPSPGKGTDTSLTSTAPVGLSDDELAEWSKSKGFRIEEAGEQAGLFGDNDKIVRVFRIGRGGKEQAGLAYQHQLEALQKPSNEPQEPFVLTGGETPEEAQPRLFGAGDLGEIIGPTGERQPSLRPKDDYSLFRKEEDRTIFDELAHGEEGSLTPSSLKPSAVKGFYRQWINRVIDENLDLGEKYRRVKEHDPEIAALLHDKDHAPRYYHDKAESNVHQVTKGLSEEQIRQASMLSDVDAREYLQEHYPDQYEAATKDPEVMAAVQRFKPYQEEITALRMALGWHVRRDLTVFENEPDDEGKISWSVLDRDGDEVEQFTSYKKAEKFVEQNGKILDHLKRTYPEHLREPLMGMTSEGPSLGATYGGIKPPRPDRKKRLATAEYFYQHGAKDFSGYIKSYTQVRHAALNQRIFDQLTSNAEQWREGNAMPPQIEYRGETYYSPQVAQSMKMAKPENRPKVIREYRAYDPAKDDKALIKDFENGWSTRTTGRPGISPSDRWLAPKEVVEALEQYDMTRGHQEKDSIRRFFQEQIIGLFGPTVHVLNIMRRLAHTVGSGAWDPRVWPYYQKLFFSKELRERLAEGLADDAIDALSKNGTYTNARDVGSLHAYVLGNMNPANWVRQTIGKFSKGVLFDPKFMNGWGALDQKARILGYDYLHEEQGWSEKEAAKNVEDAFGNYNRANWTERMKRWARLLLFPGWDFSSLKWFLQHPLKTAVLPSLVTLGANLALNYFGKNRDQDKYDYGYLHYGDRKFRSSLFTESMASHLAEPLLSAGRAALEGGDTRDIASAAGQGAIRGGGGFFGVMRPDLQAALNLASNRQYLGGEKEIWKPEDANLPGKVLPTRQLDKMAAFALVKSFPAINRFLDASYDNVDWATGAGSVLGVTNYRSGAEQRLRANAARAKGYSQTLSELSAADPEAALRYVQEPDKAMYLVFNKDLAELEADLKNIDKQSEDIKLAPIIARADREKALRALEDSRKQILNSADAIADAMTSIKLGMKKPQ